MARALWLWGPVAAWMAAIFAVSAVTFPPGGPGIPDWLSHGLAYMALGLLICRAQAGGFAPLTPAQAALAVGACVLYGISDEFHQSFVPGRTPDVWDVVKDTGGALLGAWGFWLRHAAPAPTQQRGLTQG